MMCIMVVKDSNKMMSFNSFFSILLKCYICVTHTSFSVLSDLLLLWVVENVVAFFSFLAALTEACCTSDLLSSNPFNLTEVAQLNWNYYLQHHHHD